MQVVWPSQPDEATAKVLLLQQDKDYEDDNDAGCGQRVQKRSEN
jgi:hypothetical protein